MMLRRFLPILTVAILITACEDPVIYVPPTNITTPSDIYGDMYKDLMIADTTDNSKQFADALPKIDIREIKLTYRKQKNDEGFDALAFKKEYWELGLPRNTGYIADSTASISDISGKLWNTLTYDASNTNDQSSLIKLPHPYIPISGEDIEMRYWDSYLIMQGLVVNDRWDMIEDMVDNFAHLIDLLGYIPEANRSYMVSRSGPPFFAMMIDLLASHKGEEIYTQYLPQLEREYGYWQAGKTKIGEKTNLNRLLRIDDKIYNRYYDDNDQPRDEFYRSDRKNNTYLIRHRRTASASGWEYTSRWRSQPENPGTIRSVYKVPVDLNALLYHYEKTLLKAYKLSGNSSHNESLNAQLDFRKIELDSLHWNNQLNIFEDFVQRRTQEQNKFKEERTGRSTTAMVYPLFTKMCNQEQADGVAEFLAKTLLKDGGLMDTDEFTGGIWDAPNGHAPMQYLAVIGLDNYGHTALAKKIAKGYTETIEKVFAKTGRITEKYNLSESEAAKMAGEYQGKDAYSWTLGTYLALKKYLN